MNFSFSFIISITLFISANGSLLSTFSPLTIEQIEILNDFPFSISNTDALTEESYDILSNITNAIKYLPANLTQYVIDNSPLFDITMVRFYCKNPTTGVRSLTYLNDPDVLTKIDCSKKMSFVVHGWISYGTDTWLNDMTDNIADYQDQNACAVSWPVLAFTGYIFSSLVGTRVTSLITTSFIQNLIDATCITLDDVTLIGHSLGAHIVGYIGNEFNGQVPIIFGLDPAGPRFSYPIIVDDYWRLDPGDAQFVVAIHTCDPILGITIRVGHQEVYINKGQWIDQEGCFPWNYIDAYFPETFMCAHFRVVQLMNDSINPAKNALCQMIECSSSALYDLHACLGDSIVFGFNAPRVPGTYYMSYNGTPVCANKLYI